MLVGSVNLIHSLLWVSTSLDHIVQLISVPRPIRLLGKHEGGIIRDPLSSLVWKTTISCSGMGRNVCSLTMPTQHFQLYWHVRDFFTSVGHGHGWTEYCFELYSHKISGDPSVLNCPQTDTEDDLPILRKGVEALSLIHIWRCRRLDACRSRWSPYH